MMIDQNIPEPKPPCKTRLKAKLGSASLSWLLVLWQIIKDIIEMSKKKKGEKTK